MLEFKKMSEDDLYLFVERLLNDDDLFVKQQPERNTSIFGKKMMKVNKLSRNLFQNIIIEMNLFI